MLRKRRHLSLEQAEEARRERQVTAGRGPFSPQASLKEKRIVLTPRLMIFGLVILVFLGLVGYIFYSVKNFPSPPNLEISSPVADSVIKQDTVEVVCKT